MRHPADSASTPPRVTELRFTREPRDPRWELRAGGPGSHVALLGWIVDGHAADAGVPEDAAGVIVRAACRSHVATFFDPRVTGTAAGSTWKAVPGGSACVLKPPVLKQALRRPAFPLMATSDPRIARGLFDAEGFSWELRAQMILLSRAGSPPPSLTYGHVERLFQNEPINASDVRLPAGVTGVLFPGVDGDFVELIAFEEPLWRTFPEELERECRDAGIGWSVVPEDAFKNTRWVTDIHT